MPVVHVNTPARGTKPPLTKRQIEIIRLVAQGLTSERTGQHLGLSEDAVKVHIKNAMRQWHARSRTHLVYLACSHGVIPMAGEADA